MLCGLKQVGRCSRSSKAAQNVKPVRGVRREEVRNRAWCPAWSIEEVDWPLSNAALPDVHILLRRQFVDVLLLKDEGQRLLSSLSALREGPCVFVSRECAEVIVILLDVWRTREWVAPDSVLKYRIPDVPAASPRQRRIGTYKRFVNSARVPASRVHEFGL